MSVSPVINLVILLSFTYFIGSLLVSTINEAISSVFKMRSRTLKEGIEKLLFQPDWKAYVEHEFLKNPFIQSLMKSPKKLPSYIPSKNFALAILEHCKFYDCAQSLDDMKKSVENCVLPASMRNVVVAMLHHTQGNVEKMQIELEQFYNNAMDRVTGWYKEKVQYMIIVISFLFAAFLNVDTISIITSSLHDKKNLEETADKIAASVPNMRLAGDSVIIERAEGSINVKSYPSKLKRDNGGGVPDTTTTDVTTGLANAKASVAGFRALTLLYEQNTNNSLGYKRPED